MTPKKIPSTLILPVPFSAQAPTNNWSRNEDCEETSVVMAYAFLTGMTENKFSPQVVQEAINSLKKWEESNLGYNDDTGANVTSKMAEGTFGLKIKQIENYTEEDLKRAITNGHPILLPINAKLLGSPQYFADGPTYHMLVIRGFKDNIFIVNDPGTNSGDGQEYYFSTLQKASADWDHNTKSMDPNRKISLIVSI
ncbi:MAG: C39 family peptidase [Candidatus Magasanikiibacteriota bacterium]